MTQADVEDLAEELLALGVVADKGTARAMANDPRNWPKVEDV